MAPKHSYIVAIIKQIKTDGSSEDTYKFKVLSDVSEKDWLGSQTQIDMVHAWTKAQIEEFKGVGKDFFRDWGVKLVNLTSASDLESIIETAKTKI